EIGVDREDTIVAAAKECETLETPISDQTIEQHRRCQCIELTAAILDLHRPEVRELSLLHGVLREARVAAQPAAALRVEAARRPLATAPALRVQKCHGRRDENAATDESLQPLSVHGYFAAVGFTTKQYSVPSYVPR